MEEQYPFASNADYECDPDITHSDYLPTENFPENLPQENHPPDNFSDSMLSTSLGVITYLTDCGLGEFEKVPNVLYCLRLAIVTLLHQCIYADKELYADYIQAFLRKTQLLVGKLITPALKMCRHQVQTEVCRQVIRECYALILLVYLFANPLKISKILTDSYGLPNLHGINVTSLETNLLLEIARELQIELGAYSTSLNRKSKDGDNNNTARNVCVGLVDSALDLVSLLIVTVITNSVPTSVLFLYFKDLLACSSFSLLDFEYFEEFLNHFAAVNDLAEKKTKTELFEFQKRMIQPHFLEVIVSFTSNCFTWCTRAQSLDYLQVFIDIYNEVYGTDLTLEAACNFEELENFGEEEITQAESQAESMNEEGTVLKNKDHLEPLDRGHYRNYYEGMRQEHTPVPEFVHYFEENSPESLNGLSSTPNPPGNCSVSTAPCFKADETDFKQQRFGVSKTTFSAILSSSLREKVNLLNEAVAQEVRGLRSDFEEEHMEARVFLDRKPKHEVKCYKCKYIPWHRHHN